MLLERDADTNHDLRTQLESADKENEDYWG